MASYTITYNDKVQGFPSFFSYEPEQIQGMNNRMYTFKGGNMFVHNPNSSPNNNFYDTQYNSTVSTVMNEDVLDNKIFKTINLEGTHPWDITLTSDLQSTGSISSTWFEKLENSFRAYVRNTGGDPIDAEDIPLRSMEGVGTAAFYSTAGAEDTIRFEMSVSLRNVNVGDAVYGAAAPAYDTLLKVGVVSAVTIDATSGLNYLSVDNSGVTNPLSGVNPYIMTAKSALAESHGVTGHYGAITLTQDSIEDVELFVVEAEVMSSKT
jgi:hypothetical protein